MDIVTVVTVGERFSSVRVQYKQATTLRPVSERQVHRSVSLRITGCPGRHSMPARRAV